MTNIVLSLPDSKRLHELDILRALAVFLVLGRHLLEIPETLSPALRTFLLVWREIGWIGVDLFFVLSGYLVSGLLFREYQSSQRVQITRFLIRRGFKIYPPFYVFTAATFFLSDYLPISSERWRYLGEVSFLQNYLGAVWNHTWSLAVEEHFYILLSIVVLVLVRANDSSTNPFRFLVPLILSTMVFVLVLRCTVVSLYPAGDWAPFITQTHFRIDSLLSGVLLAYLFYYESAVLKSTVERFKPLLLWVGLCLITVPMFTPLSEGTFAYTMGFTCLYLGFVAVISPIIISQSGMKSWIIKLCAPMLVPIGRASYSIYLWHMLVYYLSGSLVEVSDPSPAQFLSRLMVYLIGSIAVGIIMFRLIEIPSLLLRERFYSRAERYPVVTDALKDDVMCSSSLSTCDERQSA